MYTKIEITGEIEVVTGLHIGGSSAFAAIGAVDAPVIKDVGTGIPMIPGSSLKGKLRALLAKKYNTELAEKPDQDHPRLLRLFGSAKKNAVQPSRIQIADMIMENDDDIRRRTGSAITEVKFENTINRLTAVANPRQIERVIRGSRFPLSMIYSVERTELEETQKEILEDFAVLADGMKMLQYDYLGGNGSRGYGKIQFQDIRAEVVIGELDEELMDQCNRMLQEALRG